MNWDDPFIDVCIHGATTTAQVFYGPAERPHISAVHRGAPSIAAKPPLPPPPEPPAWWIAEQQNEAPPDLSVLLRSKTGLFILLPTTTHLSTTSFILPEPGDVCACRFFCHFGDCRFPRCNRVWAFLKKKKPLGRRSYEGSLWQRDEVKRRHTESFESEWPDRKSASGRAHRGCSFGLEKHRTRGHWQFSTSLLLQWSGSSV